MVLQPGKKVVKPYLDIDNDQRFHALESQISELKSLLLLNESANFNKNEKEDNSEWARGDSNARSPPCEDGGFGGF
jgi:hypothetical protein